MIYGHIHGEHHNVVTKNKLFYCEFFWKWTSQILGFQMVCVKRMASKSVCSNGLCQKGPCRNICKDFPSEVESSRTSLASRTSSRTHFEVLGLGLEASSPWPWPWPRSLRSSKTALSSARGQHYFWTVKILSENAINLVENLYIPFLFCAIGA